MFKPFLYEFLVSCPLQTETINTIAYGYFYNMKQLAKLHTRARVQNTLKTMQNYLENVS